VDQVLPPLLIALASVALTLVLLSLWSSVRALLAASTGVHATSQALPERERLLAEKRALLTSIKDLEFEHDVGKLSDEDYERFDARYRAAAREVLRTLEEQVGPHRERARGLIAERLAGAGASTEEASTRTSTRTSTSTVHGCGASNDEDAVFCKKCGERLRESAT
jgi:hypothetical protein